MNRLDQFAADWYAWMLDASWQLALLVVIVTVIVELLSLTPVSARVRHALWLIVLIKACLPPWLAAPFGMGAWVIGPWLGRYPEWGTAMTDGPDPEADVQEVDPTAGGWLSQAVEFVLATQTWFWIWLIGVAVVWLWAAVRYQLLRMQLESTRVVDGGPLRVLLDRTALDLGVNAKPDLLVADWLPSPFLFGLWRPVIVLPANFLSRASHPEIAALFAHELIHFRRRDPWVGVAMLMVQSLYWFHPLIWWANYRLRKERETVCDEVILGERLTSEDTYADALLSAIGNSAGFRMAGGAASGILERDPNLKMRLEQIMNFQARWRRFGWLAKLAVAATALLLLPMSPLGWSPLAADKPFVVERQLPETGYPRIVKSNPAIGAIDVPTTLNEVRVTFDQRMAGGMSWTGQPPLFPEIDTSGKVGWVDKVTCALPVKLEAGKFYRIGINSESHQNFSSEEGVPVPPTAIYFVTEGATEEVKAMATRPQVTRLDPADGATNVDPARKQISVTFNVPMGKSMSWTGRPASFPDTPGGRGATWSDDGRTCTLPVELQPNRHYRLGLNSPSFRNFQTEFGIPLEPVDWEFQTQSP